MTNESDGGAIQREFHPISSEQVDTIFRAIDEVRERVAALEADAARRPDRMCPSGPGAIFD